MQQPQTAAAAAASSDIPPCTNSSLTEHSLSQEVPHKPPYVLRCGDRHLVGRVQFAGGVLSEKRHSQKNPARTKQNNSWNHDVTVWTERRSEEGKKRHKMKSYRETGDYGMAIKKANSQLERKWITRQLQNLYTATTGTKPKLLGLFTHRRNGNLWPTSPLKKKKKRKILTTECINEWTCALNMMLTQEYFTNFCTACTKFNTLFLEIFPPTHSWKTMTPTH